MNSLFLKLLSVFFVSVYSEGNVQYISEGSSAILPCNIDFVNGSYWVGPNSSFLGSGRPFDQETGLRSLYVNINETTGQYDLVLEGFSKSDEGIYSCYCGTGEYWTNYTLYLQEPPTNILVNGKTNMERISGVEGQQMDLECSVVGGKPVPEVWWVYQNEILNHSSTGSVLYTMKSVTRAMDLSFIKCNAMNQALTQPMTQDIQIMLALKPSAPIFDHESIETDVTAPLIVTCSSSGGRPTPVFQWFLSGFDVSGHATKHSQGEVALSTLVYRVDKSLDKTNITCMVLHDVTDTELKITSLINVKYPPLVEITSNTTTNVTAGKITLRCEGRGNPPSYDYQWIHLSVYNELIRTLSGDSGGNLELPPPYYGSHLTYGDSGLYVCSVSNGVTDENGHVTQNGTTALVVETQPVFLMNDDSNVQYGQLGKTVAIHAFVHVEPEMFNMTWFYNQQLNMNNRNRRKRHEKQLIRTRRLPISNTDKYTLSTSEKSTAKVPALVEYTIDVYKLTLTVTNVTFEDFTTYTIRVGNQYGENELTINFRSSDVPETPTNFSVLAVSDTTAVTLKWIPAFDGGHRQWFCVDYRLINATSWTRITISQAVDDSNMDGKPQLIAFLLTDLAPSSTYEIRILAMNVIGGSQPTETMVLRTLDLPFQDYRSYGGILGGALSGVFASVLLVGITTMALLHRARRLKMMKARSRELSEGPAKSSAFWSKDVICNMSGLQDFTITMETKPDQHAHQ